MIVDVAIGYQITYLKRGSRKQRTAFVVDTAPVVIPETDEAVPAVEIVTAAGMRMSWRTVSGNLFFESPIPQRAGQSGIPGLLAGHDFYNPLWRHPLLPGAVTRVADATVELDMREIISDTRDDAVRAVSVAAAGMFAWKGTLLTPSQGPRLYLSRLERDRMEVLVDDLRPWRPDIDALSFSVVDLAEMMDHAKDVGFELKPGPLECMVTQEAVALLPSIRDRALIAAADSFLRDDMPDRNVSNYSFEHIAAHLEYTDDALDRVKVTPELERVLRRGVDGAIEGRYRNAAMKAIERQVVHARFALAGWDARPGLHADETEAPVSPAP